jgi:hypothetical protein
LVGGQWNPNTDSNTTLQAFNTASIARVCEHLSNLALLGCFVSFVLCWNTRSLQLVPSTPVHTAAPATPLEPKLPLQDWNATASKDLKLPLLIAYFLTQPQLNESVAGSASPKKGCHDFNPERLDLVPLHLKMLGCGSLRTAEFLNVGFREAHSVSVWNF